MVANHRLCTWHNLKLSCPPDPDSLQVISSLTLILNMLISRHIVTIPKEHDCRHIPSKSGLHLPLVPTFSTADEQICMCAIPFVPNRALL